MSLRVLPRASGLMLAASRFPPPQVRLFRRLCSNTGIDLFGNPVGEGEVEEAGTYRYDVQSVNAAAVELRRRIEELQDLEKIRSEKLSGWLPGLGGMDLFEDTEFRTAATIDANSYHGIKRQMQRFIEAYGTILQERTKDEGAVTEARALLKDNINFFKEQMPRIARHTSWTRDGL